MSGLTLGAMVNKSRTIPAVLAVVALTHFDRLLPR